MRHFQNKCDSDPQRSVEIMTAGSLATEVRESAKMSWDRTSQVDAVFNLHQETQDTAISRRS
ncbi:hypothetical protein ALQ25_200286 [Pseudomonas coronafaciens pv. atropurpurea]|nr:hypothetical protein ALQ25_200286 [Pseudomonas coronafaciens pv. atropurpurea]